MKSLKFKSRLLFSCFATFVLSTLLFVSCDVENIAPETEANAEKNTSAQKGNKDKIDVCHYSADDDQWILINVKESSWKAHANHGDVRLDDQDGDGFVPDNECGIGPMGDCDDTNAEIYPGVMAQNWFYLEDLDGDDWYVYFREADFFGTCPPEEGYRTFDQANELLLGDCDDTNAAVNPGAPEICDDVDNNCDGWLFDRSASTSYLGDTFASGIAFFGTAGTVSGEFVHYDSLTGCNPIGDDLTGKIALIERGASDCFFNQKALNAQNAGAIGVIICNRDDGILNMTPGLPDEITIPVILLASSDCQTILAGGGTVSFTVEDTCVDPGARSAANTKSKTSNSRTGFNANEKVMQ